MLAYFSRSLIDSLGRTVEVQPLEQIVELIVAGLTAGFSAPGVHLRSGSLYRPEPRWWQLPAAGWDWKLWALAVE